MKKVFSVITVFLFGLLLVACNDSTPVVKNLSIENHVLKWDEVGKAEKYIVVVGDIEHEVAVNQFNLMELNLGAGEHIVGVKVVVGGKTSALSKTVKYLVDLSLKTPENLKITGTVVSWDSVEDATSYIVHVNEKTYEVSVTTFDLSNLDLAVGGHNIKVRAVQAEKTSAFSNVVTYVIAYEVSDEEKNKILKLYSELYSVNMKEEDFNDQNQYEIYLLRVAYLEAYIEAATVNNLPIGNVYSLFNNLTKVITEEVDLTNFDEFVEYIELLEKEGLTGNLLGAILHHKTIMNIKISEFDVNDNILNFEELLLNEMAAFEEQKELHNYELLVETISKYATTEEETLAVRELTSTLSWYVFSELYNISYNVMEDNNFKYEGYDEENFIHITEVFKNLFSSNNEEDKEIMITGIMTFINLGYYVSNVGQLIEYYQEMLEYLEETKEQMQIYITILEQDKEAVISAFESTYDFVVVMKNTLNSEQASVIMNKLFAGESLTIAEVILIKDIILPVIKNSVPSEKELEEAYKLIITVLIEAGFDGSYNDLIEYAKQMAQSTSITIDIILEFVEELDSIYLNEVKNMLSNEENIVNVLVYTLEYYEDFIVRIKERYDGVLTDEEIETLYVMFIDMIININEQSGNLEGLEVLIMIRDNYDLFSKLYNQYSDKVIPLIISLTKVYSTINELESELTSKAIDELIAEIVNLDSIIFADFGIENLTTILEILTFVVNLDFSEMFENETEALIEIVLSLNEIKTKILAEANKLEASLYFEHPSLATGDYKEIQYKMIYFIVTALDNALTEEVKTEIERLVTLAFTEVLANEYLVTMLGLEEFDLDELKARLLDMISIYTGLISELANYDYNNLTTEQWETLEMIADGLFGNENYDYNFSDAIKVNASEFEWIIVEDLYGPLVYEIVFNETGSYEYQLVFSESNLIVELYSLDQDGRMYLLETTQGIYSYLYLDVEYVYYLVIQEEYGGLINIEMLLGLA